VALSTDVLMVSGPATKTMSLCPRLTRYFTAWYAPSTLSETTELTPPSEIFLSTVTKGNERLRSIAAAVSSPPVGCTMRPSIPLCTRFSMCSFSSSALFIESQRMEM
jgi:hypothetical protein